MLLQDDRIFRLFFPRGPKHDAPHRWLTFFGHRACNLCHPNGECQLDPGIRQKNIGAKVVTRQFAPAHFTHDRGFLGPFPCSSFGFPSWHIHGNRKACCASETATASCDLVYLCRLYPKGQSGSKVARCKHQIQMLRSPQSCPHWLIEKLPRSMVLSIDRG